MLGVFGAVAPRDTFPQARRAVDKALEIAPELGEAYASLGHIKVQYEHDWSGAERAYRRAIELNPTFARAAQWYGLFLGYQGRFDESIAQLRRAQELEPAQPVHGALIGMVLMYQRRYDDAIEQLQLTLQMDPNFPTTNTYLAAAYLRRGDYEKAMEHLGRAKSLAPGSQGTPGRSMRYPGGAPRRCRRSSGCGRCRSSVTCRPTTSRRSTRRWERPTRRSNGSNARSRSARRSSAGCGGMPCSMVSGPTRATRSWRGAFHKVPATKFAKRTLR